MTIRFPGVQVYIGRKRNRPITYDDLVDAETRVLVVEEALAQAEDRFVSCDQCERPTLEDDLETIWCTEQESGEQIDARICLICRLEGGGR